jgi:hypothetical protein
LIDSSNCGHLIGYNHHYGGHGLGLVGSYGHFSDFDNHGIDQHYNQGFGQSYGHDIGHGYGPYYYDTHVDQGHYGHYGLPLYRHGGH